MHRRTGLVSFCCVILLSSSSWAATVDPVRGTASINQGQGFQAIFTRVQGNVGDSVMVGPGGSATITYDDGCKQDVNPGAVVTIQNPSPCAAGAFAQTGDPLFWGALGATAIAGAVAACEAIQGCLSGSSTPRPVPLSP
jgi:hypothetical protein